MIKVKLGSCRVVSRTTKHSPESKDGKPDSEEESEFAEELCPEEKSDSGKMRAFTVIRQARSSMGFMEGGTRYYSAGMFVKSKNESGTTSMHVHAHGLDGR
jgi:hypothetical protein